MNYEIKYSDINDQFVSMVELTNYELLSLLNNSLMKSNSELYAKLLTIQDQLHKVEIEIKNSIDSFDYYQGNID